MQIDIAKLLTGKATKIKDKQFFQTAAYVEPFLERMQKYTSDFRVNVKLPDQITNVEECEDITYNRVWIQAVLPDEYSFENHQKVFGMVYGLDTRKPVAKFYAGGLNMACTNLCVFSPDMLEVQELQPETAINFKPLQKIAETTDNVVAYLTRLINMDVDCSEQNVNEMLGMWVRNCMYNSYDSGFGKVKLATSTAIDAYKLLFEDDKSPYFVSENQDTNMFNVYNAFTQVITDNIKKEIINNCEKTLLLKDILNFGIN